MSTVRRTSLSFFFFFNDTATTEIYTLSLHDALPIYPALRHPVVVRKLPQDRWLRRPAQDPRREDPAGAGHRDGQGLGPAWPRWRWLPDRPEVVLHAQGQHAEVHPLQLGRIRAGHLQGP